MAGGKVRPVTKDQIIKGLVGHVKMIRFYSQVNGESLKDLKQGCDLLYSQVIPLSQCEEWIQKD